MPKPWPLKSNEVNERVQTLTDGIVVLDESSYVDRETLAKFIDRDFGEWWVKPRYVLRGNGRHPERVAQLKKQARKIDVKDVMTRVNKIHNGRVTLLIETYVDTHSYATFVDNEYGEWLAKPYSVMQGRGHPRGRLKKSLATQRSLPPVAHWKTGEICYPSSSYEHAVLVWLNKNCYDFDWQIPFRCPWTTPKQGQAAIYNVDFYIQSGPWHGMYIETKGTWSRRKDHDSGKAKWEWFHATYSNSVLWMERDLIKHGIFENRRTYLEKVKKNG